MSGIGCASSKHSMTKLSPSCLIVGFLGNLGGMPSGILVLVPITRKNVYSHEIKYISIVFRKYHYES